MSDPYSYTEVCDCCDQRTDDCIEGVCKMCREAYPEDYADLEPETETAIEKYDRLAEEFRRATGMMAPGKDVAAMGYGGGTMSERMEAWDKWLQETQTGKSCE